MGLAASQGRLLMLTARKSDLEFQIQCINQRRTVLAVQSEQLIRQYVNSIYQNDDPSTIGTGNALPGFIFSDNTITGTDPVPQSPIATGAYEQQMALVQAIDKELELREKSLDTQHKEVETEYDAVKKVIDKNIEMSFKTLG